MFKKWFTIALSIPFVLLLSLQVSHAQSSKQFAESVIFTTLEKRLIREVLGESPTQNTETRQSHKKNGKGKGKDKGHKAGKKNGLPPGLAKRNGLPPGLAKRQTLPPGLQKRSLPHDLEHRLPARKSTERVIIDNDVLLIERGTNLVLDILEDVIKDAI